MVQRIWSYFVIFLLMLNGCASVDKSTKSHCTQPRQVKIQYDAEAENLFAPRRRSDFEADKDFHIKESPQLTRFFYLACTGATAVKEESSSAYGRIIDPNTNQSVWIVSEKIVSFGAMKSTVPSAKIAEIIDLLESLPSSGISNP